MSSLRIDRRQYDAADVLDLVGDVTEEAHELIREHYDEAVASGASTIVLGIGAADYINTSGISVLINLAMDAKKQSVAISVAGASPHYQKVFDLIQFSKFVSMFDDEAAAVAAAAGG